MKAQSVPAPTPLPLPVLGMVLFISSETMFFGGLFAALFSIRSRAAEWPPAGAEPELPLALALTVVLLASSITVTIAERKGRGDALRGLPWLLVTVALGTAFLTGQLYEYSTLGFTFGDHSFGTLFLTITGFHGLHVAIGLVMLLVSTARLRQGREGVERTLRPAALYWHFVDGIWLVVLTCLYLI